MNCEGATILDSFAAQPLVATALGEVWLAIRNDGLNGTAIVGSGTLDDPCPEPGGFAAFSRCCLFVTGF